MAFFAEVNEFLTRESADAAMKPYVEPMKAALGDLQKATVWLMQNALAKPDNGAGVSYDYMHLFGRVALGYMWARIVRAALDAKAKGDAAWLDAKLTTGKFFMEKMLPETGYRLARVTAGAETMMSLPAEMF
jgi:hypothetical protein